MSQDPFNKMTSKGRQIVHGRVCALRLREYLEGTSKFVVSKMLLSLNDLELFRDAYNKAREKHSEAIKFKLEQKRLKLQKELEKLDSSFNK